MLILCVLSFLALDGVRHAQAAERLEAKGAAQDTWVYRMGHAPADKPFGFEVNSKQRAWAQSMIAFPTRMELPLMTMDAALVRDVARMGPEALVLLECRGLAPPVMRELCAQHSLRKIEFLLTDVSAEGLNLLWTTQPDLERMSITGTVPGEDGFRDIRHARKLRLLFLKGKGIDDRVIARLREAPALETLVLDDALLTEESAPVLAAMPALRRLTFSTRNPEISAYRIAARVHELNPAVRAFGNGPSPLNPIHR